MLPPSRAKVTRAFGATIRALRQQRGMSQETLALDAEVSRRYMSSLEQGRHNPSIHLVCRLLAHLKTSWVTYGAEFETHLRSEKNNSE